VAEKLESTMIPARRNDPRTKKQNVAHSDKTRRTHSRSQRIAPAGPEIEADPAIAAKTAHLRYETADSQGIHREFSGRGFRFFDFRRRPVRDPKTLGRIRSLVIPPAWTDVWICAREDGHLQATGRDARGRKQYCYHPRWREVRDEAKYARMLAFGAALPRIRRQVRRDLKRPGLPREKVLAIVVFLLENALIRIGNEEYTRTNGSFGLTTLQDRHAKIQGATIHFQFRGKSGKMRSVNLTNKRLARLIKRCQDLPGHTLFQYLDGDGKP
jgi:DNA topoisomerase I